MFFERKPKSPIGEVNSKGLFCGVEFLKPQVLYGLLALGIPVIIHLFNFRRPKKLVFPDIRFIKRVVEQNKKQRQVKHLLLLLVRMLFFFFLIAAFAQPFLPADSKKETRAAEVKIFLDNSFSMLGQGKTATLFEEAKNRARMIAAKAPKGTQFSLISNQTSRSSSRSMDYNGLLKQLDDLQIGPFSSDASTIYSKMAGGPGVECWWITDGQRSHLQLEKLSLDSAQANKMVLLQAEKKSNCWIDTVWMDAPFARKGQELTFFVRIKGSGNAKLTNFPIQFYVDGIQKGLRNTSLNADGTVTEKFTYTPIHGDAQRILFKIQDFPISFDDTWYASLQAIESAKVLQVFDTKPEPAIERVFSTEPGVQLEKKQVLSLNPSQIQEQQLIILDGVSGLSAGLLASLSSYLEEGGVIFQIPDMSNLQKASSIWLFDSKLNQHLEGVYKAVPVNKIELSDGLFKGVFTNLPENLQYPLASKYLRLSRNNLFGYSTILGLSDNSPFLMKKRVGKGVLYLITSDLKTENSNLASHSFFVPLMLQMPFQIRRVMPLSWILGRRNFIEPLSERPKGIVKLISEKTQVAAGVESRNGKWGFALSPEIQKAGWYAIQVDGAKIVGQLGLNFPRSESELKFYEESDFAQKGFDLFSSDEAAFSNELASSATGKPLWKWSLLLAILFLGIEFLLLKRLSE